MYGKLGSVDIFAYCEPVDMRNGLEGLSCTPSENDADKRNGARLRARYGPTANSRRLVTLCSRVWSRRCGPVGEAVNREPAVF